MVSKIMSGFSGYNETKCMRLYGRGLKREIGFIRFLRLKVI